MLWIYSLGYRWFVFESKTWLASAINCLKYWTVFRKMEEGILVILNLLMILSEFLSPKSVYSSFKKKKNILWGSTVPWFIEEKMTEYLTVGPFWENCTCRVNYYKQFGKDWRSGLKFKYYYDFLKLSVEHVIDTPFVDSQHGLSGIYRSRLHDQAYIVVSSINKLMLLTELMG